MAEVAEILINLYQLFQSKDATMVEINPFAEDSSGNFFCLDAKLRFDDNAEFRQKAVFDQVKYNCANIMYEAFYLHH